jgi:TolB-like protein/DNA-binding winged helix-turn-helix (wHTH) protein
LRLPKPPHELVLRVGDLRVDPALDEICKDGSTIKVEPRTMRLLVVLAEHAGQVVSVEELLAEVWKDVIVGPDSVYQAVAGLRRVLGDDPKAPMYIANVMRRGYRLVAPVAPWSEALVNPVAPLPANNPVNASPAAPDAAEWSAADRAPAVREPPPRRPFVAPVVVLIGVLLVLGAFLAQKVWRSTHPATVAVADKSVAVLPFLDLSEKKDEEYFADGMSEELIDGLARVPELRIPARTSSFYFKGKQATIAEIAKALGVAHVLEGSVRKSGDTLRITAQLIRADTGYHVWSQTFDRPTADVFKVQDEIAAAVLQSLKLSLLAPAMAKPAPTTNTAAYTLYLKARSFDNVSEYGLAKKYLQQALALDPGFAEGWATFAYILTEDFETLDSRRTPELCSSAHAAADEALKLNPGLPTAHNAKGRILAACDWNWTAAEAEYSRALALDPGNARVLRSYASFEWSVEHYERSLELAQKAVSLDPLNEWNYLCLAFAQGALGKLAEAEASYRKQLELDPLAGHGLLSVAISAQGRPQEALVEVERDDNEQVRGMNYPFYYDELGRKEDADRAIASYIQKYGDRDPETIGTFYACRKNFDQAIVWFTRMVAIRAVFAEIPPRLACLRSMDNEPRFQAIRRQINYPK